MKLYESIKNNLKESFGWKSLTDWKALRDGLKDCTSADDLNDLMQNTMDSNDYSKYCDYYYEIENKSDLAYAKAELNKLAKTNANKTSDELEEENYQEYRKFEKERHKVCNESFYKLLKNKFKPAIDSEFNITSKLTKDNYGNNTLTFNLNNREYIIFPQDNHSRDYEHSGYAYNTKTLDGSLDDIYDPYIHSTSQRDVIYSIDNSLSARISESNITDLINKIKKLDTLLSGSSNSVGKKSGVTSLFKIMNDLTNLGIPCHRGSQDQAYTVILDIKPRLYLKIYAKCPGSEKGNLGLCPYSPKEYWTPLIDHLEKTLHLQKHQFNSYFSRGYILNYDDIPNLCNEISDYINKQGGAIN